MTCASVTDEMADPYLTSIEESSEADSQPKYKVPKRCPDNLIFAKNPRSPVPRSSPGSTDHGVAGFSLVSPSF